MDLAPIKPIRGVKTILGDITTQQCRAAIRKEAGGSLMDVVLHDGALVGGQLHSGRLALLLLPGTSGGCVADSTTRAPCWQHPEPPLRISCPPCATGAPNVGGAWATEAYSQAWLVLESLRMATDMLAPKGTFVTKVFR